VSAPSLAHALVAPALGLAVVLAVGVVIFAIADAAGRRGRRDAAQIRAGIRRREQGRASWEA
jgi:hypothetical protein